MVESENRGVDGLEELLGAEDLRFIRFQLLPVYTLIIAVGAFDLYTRKRLHPVYLRAIAWSLPIHGAVRIGDPK